MRMEQPLKIVLLEDNPADVELIQRVLRKAGMPFECVVADTREEFIQGLESLQPDLVLSDHSLPQFNSLEALTLARTFNPDLPFILVTGAVSEEFAVTVIKEGADDYILKDHLVRLPSAIGNAIQKREAEKERGQMLERLLFTNNELSTFLYKATHDLRGPLTSIMGLARLALRDEQPSDCGHRQHLSLISESAQKLDEILVSLIQTMAIKNSALTITGIDPEVLLNNVLRSIEFMPGYQSMRITVDVSCRRRFLSDERILSSILQNVIENSIKYRNHLLHDGFIRITVKDTKDGICATIEDNGIGIDTQSQEKVFDMFYRGNTISKGSGLGLYLVKNGVQRLGGTIRLTSREGMGTRIILDIPSAIVPAVEGT